MFGRIGAWLERTDLVTRAIIGVCGVAAIIGPAALKIINTGPERDAVSAFKTGQSFFGAGDFDGAEAAFTKALEVSPDYPDALYFRARSRAVLQRYDEAIEDVDRLKKIDGENSRSYTLSGFIYFTIKDFPKVEADLDRALELSPDDTLALYTRAQYFAWRHDYEGTVRDLQRLRAVKPLTKKSMTLLAGAYSRMGETEKAADTCKQMLRMDKKDANSPNLCGLIYHRAGDYDRAIEFYNRALKLNPKADDVKANIELASSERPPSGTLENEP